MTMLTERWLVRGRVQGVGYREWMVREAGRHAVAGWVRNRDEGHVEALVHGEAVAVARLLEACRRGPPLASVAALERESAAPPAEIGFHRRTTC